MGFLLGSGLTLTARARSTAASALMAASAQKALRQPKSVPSQAPPGTPITLARLRPPMSAASERATTAGGATRAVCTAATAQNAPHATAAMTREVMRMA